MLDKVKEFVGPLAELVAGLSSIIAKAITAPDDLPALKAEALEMVQGTITRLRNLPAEIAANDRDASELAKQQ